MASSLEPNAGLHQGWTAAESGWADEMTENLIAIGAIIRLTVKDKDLTVPAGTEVEGDCLIVATGGSGSFASKDGKVAVRKGAGWLFITPKEGWEAWVQDENKKYIFDGSVWQPSMGLALGTWTACTGTVSRAGFDTSTATTGNVAQALAALIADLQAQKVL